MRYLIAFSIACTLILAVTIYMNRMQDSLQQRLRQRFPQGQTATKQPENGESQPNDFTDYGTEVTSSEFFAISLVDSWITYRWILISITILASLFIAWLTRSWGGS